MGNDFDDEQRNLAFNAYLETRYSNIKEKAKAKGLLVDIVIGLPSVFEEQLETISDPPEMGLEESLNWIDAYVDQYDTTK